MTDAAARAFLDEYAQDAGTLDWLQARRDTAIETFRRIGLPSLRQESWKYTDMRILARRRFRAATHAGSPVLSEAARAHRYGSDACHELVFVNGRLVPDPGAHATLPEMGIQSLAEAGRKAPARVAEHLGRNADEARAFVALNTAFMTDGAVMDIANGADLRKPFHLLYVCTPASEPVAVYTRNLIRLGANARATIIETFIGGDGEYFTNAVTEVELGPGAVLDHYKVQQEGANAVHVGCLAARQDRDSRFESHSVSLGGLLVRNDIDVRLAAEGAETRLNGLYVAGGKQHVDNHTRIDHEQPHTRSRENYRGVLDGRARAVFNGKVVVHKAAQKTDAEQSNSNLLLSSEAEVDTKPELEIYADDVKCSHGATVGQLDEDMLFYLRARAIPEATARNLLTFAFAEEIIRPMQCRMVRDRLERSVARKLPGSAVIGEFMQ